MRVRADSVFVSSLLLTAALLYFIWPSLWNFFPLGHILLAPVDENGFRGEAQTVASLAIILIGLIVVWTSYAKCSRLAWFLMFVIVWLWTFPRFILSIVPLLMRERSSFTFPELLSDALLGPGFQRDVVVLTSAFFLMVVGLALPIGRVFVARKRDEPTHLPPRRLAISLLISAPVVALALYCWLRVGITYELTTGQLNNFSPSPPPPPTLPK